jgi:hypothetical protein
MGSEAMALRIKAPELAIGIPSALSAIGSAGFRE